MTDGRVITFYKNGVEAGTATLRALEFCDGYKRLKYLDKKGQYRFFSFTKFYQGNDNPKKIGSTNEFITSILDAQTNSKNIGYRNERTLSLSAEVSEDELIVLSELYTSPRIYLYIGSGTSDTAADWLELSEVRGDTIFKRRKQKTGLINIEITLPEWFTVKMI